MSKRMTWARESGYIFSLIGSAVGFANLLSFSAQCYKNGGGAFLIPFILANIFIGLPLLILEGIVGQRFALPFIGAFEKTSLPFTKFFGWISILTCLTIGMFYIVLTGWCVAYIKYAAFAEIPQDTSYFFQNQFLQVSGGLHEIGKLSIPISIATLLVAFFSWWVLAKNIRQGIENACSFFLPILGVLILVFVVMVCFLPGANIGIWNFIAPDFSKLKDFSLWRDVCGHVFFSYSLGLGIVVGYSRYTKKETNIARAMAWVALSDFLVAILAGLVIFACVGYLSQQTQIPFNEIVKSDSTFEMGFIIFPKILHLFSPPTSQIVGVLFFFSLFIAGITGVFSIIEAVAGNIEVEFSISREKSVAITMLLTIAGALLFSCGIAVHLLGALSPMVLGNAILLSGIIEIIVFMWFAKSIRQDLNFVQNKQKTLLFYITALCIPVFLGIVLFGALSTEYYKEFSSAFVVRWAWLGLVMILSIVLTILSKRISKII